MKIDIDKALGKKLLKSVIKNRSKRQYSRVLYDDTYYKVEAIVRTPKFNRLAEQKYAEFAKHGIPVPENGLASLKQGEGLAWIEQARQRGLNPYAVPNQVLLEFGIEPTLDNYDNYRAISHGLFNKLFYKSSSMSPSPAVEILPQRDSHGVTKELLIRILPHTTKDDLTNAWGMIDMYKQFLPRKAERLRPWDEFERDFKLYLIYLKVKKRVAEGKFKDSVKTPVYQKISKSVYEQLMESDEYKDLGYEFSRESLDKIINHCNRVFGDLQLL